MQRLEVSGAVSQLYGSLGAKRLISSTFFKDKPPMRLVIFSFIWSTCHVELTLTMNSFTSVQYRRLMLNFYWHINCLIDTSTVLLKHQLSYWHINCLIRANLMWIHNTLINEPIWTILKVNKFNLSLVMLYCVDCLHFFILFYSRANFHNTKVHNLLLCRVISLKTTYDGSLL
jgi:hypothetical protein